MGDSSEVSGITIAIVGCGNMGVCVLDGICNAIVEQSKNKSASKFIVNKVLACTASQASAERLSKSYATLGDKFKALAGSNVEVIQQADVIVLGCKPHLSQGVLQEAGVREALRNKLMISVLAGTPISKLYGYINEESTEEEPLNLRIVRSMPNIGAKFKVSMTLVQDLPPTTPTRDADVVNWIFEQIGRVKFVAEASFDAAASILTTSLAVTSVLIDGMLDGAVADGLKRSEALEIAAQGLMATAKLLLEEPGCRPSTIIERMSSPRGVTIQGVMVAERGSMRSVAAETVTHSTQHAKKMAGLP